MQDTPKGSPAPTHEAPILPVNFASHPLPCTVPRNSKSDSDSSISDQ